MKGAGIKYEMVFNKMSCNMALNDDSDDEVCNEPVRSGRQIRQMAEGLRKAIKKKMLVGEYYYFDGDD